MCLFLAKTSLWRTYSRKNETLNPLLLEHYIGKGAERRGTLQTKKKKMYESCPYKVAQLAMMVIYIKSW